jgi:nitrite reductase/ring-hydroxylating ferredoxin subunit
MREPASIHNAQRSKAEYSDGEGPSLPPPAVQWHTFSNANQAGFLKHMPDVFVAKASQFPDGDRRIVNHGDTEIGVFHWQGQFFAYENLCLHQGGPACEGVMMHKVEDVLAPDKTWHGQTFSKDEIHFVCPWHGYEYDLKTGECAADRKLKLKSFNVVKRGEDIYVVTD